MDLRQLECFLAVARHLHFGRAAEELHLAQPTVSESIRRLEREVGGALFDRTSRRVVLTPLGELFVGEARVALDTVAAAYTRARSFAQHQVTELDVGFAYSLGDQLVDAVAELQRRQPDVVVTMRALSTARQIKMLHDRRLNAAFCVMPDPDPLFASLVIGTSRLVAVVTSDHPLAPAGSVALVDLAREPLIAWPRAANPALYDAFAGAMDASGAPWTLVGTASGVENVAARVLAGFGVGIVFDSVAAARPIPGVAYLSLGLGAPLVERRLVWRADDRSPAITEFVGLVRERVTAPKTTRAPRSPGALPGEQVELAVDDVLG